jgi:predicted MPP superfamily phosphohydrolase
MTTACPAIPAPTRRELVGFSLLLLWLTSGYAAILSLVLGLAWWVALREAVPCVAACGPLLLVVIGAVTLPKRLTGVSQGAYWVAAAAAGPLQYAIPWLGWSAIIWAMNAGRVSAASALVAGASVAAFSFLTGLAVMLMLRPRVQDVGVTCTEVTVDRLPHAFDGYQILHVSDIHGGGHLSRGSVPDRLAKAEALHPDLVVFTGDLAASHGAVEEAADALACLTARDGTIAVLGNHDHWIGEKRVAAALAARGARVLGNEHLTLARNGDILYMVGVKDASYVRRDDLPAALAGIPDGAPVIMLTHSPDVVYKPLSERASLILSGHTHGGQVVFPWIGPLYVPTRLGRRRMSGLLSLDGRLIFINRGLGEIFPPMRLNCPPELALLTLRRRGGAV